MRKVLYVFGLLTDEDVSWMARAGLRRRFARDAVVIAEGEPVDFLAILLEGEFLVSSGGGAALARLGVGEVVGEMSLVDSAPPSATIRAARDSRALLLDKAQLLAKLETDAGFGSRFYRALAVFLADRLRALLHPGEVGPPTLAEPDELDPGVLDRVSSGGERFHRLLRLLAAAPETAS